MRRGEQDATVAVRIADPELDAWQRPKKPLITSKLLGGHPASSLHPSFAMNTQQRSTIVGVFEDRLHANKAVTELHQAGFTQSHIGVAMRHAEGAAIAAGTGHDTHAGSGALTGALTGLGLAQVTQFERFSANSARIST